MALLQASAKPSLPARGLTKFPDHPVPAPAQPSVPTLPPETDRFRLISTDHCLRDHFSRLEHHFGITMLVTM